jgi:hypothetical protein
MTRTAVAGAVHKHREVCGFEGGNARAVVECRLKEWCVKTARAIRSFQSSGTLIAENPRE